MVTPSEIVEFWFSEPVRRHWFKATPKFDRALSECFLPTWQAAADGQLSVWEATPLGTVALVIVLDQFPLNMFRNKPESFATAAIACQIAGEAIKKDFDQRLTAVQKTFLYLPFMHSEAMADQDRAVSLFENAGLMDNLRFARHHRALIKRFGRFPHRNRILGRKSTPEEVEYLNSKDAFRG